MLSQDNLQSVIGNAAQRKGKRSSVLQQLNELKSSRSKETNRVKEKTAIQTAWDEEKESPTGDSFSLRIV
jgi:hypothetical protein